MTTIDSTAGPIDVIDTGETARSSSSCTAC